MTLDFSRHNLRRRSFKGQNLKDANFRYADIRSVHFSNAILENVDFTGVKAGLQKRWFIGLLVSLLVLSILSSLLPLVMTGAIKYIFQVFSNTEAIVITSFDCLVITFLLFIAIRKGLFSASIASVAIVIFTLFVAWMLGANGADARINAISAAAIAIVVIGTITAVVTTGIFAFVSAATCSISGLIAFSLIAIITFISGVGIASAAYTGIVAFTVTALAIGAFILSGAYIGWRTLNGDKRDAWIRPIAIAFAAIGGTNFQGADLTDADFTGATLKNTDFREATLIRTCFHNTEKLDLVRPGNTYLRNSQVRQLVITGNGKKGNFDRSDLRGVNLQGVNLENASFINAHFDQANLEGANLSNGNFDRSDLRDVNLEGANLENAHFIDADFFQANLQGANLSRTLLVRTNFERADLRGANLTGSCIQDWVITESTKLDGIVSDYVYLNWINGDKRDQEPARGQFKKDDFVTFIRSILETVELYHEKDINPRLALTVLRKMSRDYDEPLDTVAIGQRGERVFIQVKVSQNIIRENFKEDYYSRYDSGLKLWSENIHHLPPAVNSNIEKKISEIASARTDDFIFVDVRYAERDLIEIYKGDTTVTNDRNIQVGRDYRETHVNDQGTYVEGDYYNNPEQKQTLAEAAAEIQALLEQLEKSYPTDTTKDRMALATEAIAQIDSNPNLTARILSALKTGSVKAFEQFLSHPAASFVIGALEDWEKTKGV
jgi:uncharacterized protein YjbI with pentapeptide repeats